MCRFSGQHATLYWCLVLLCLRMSCRVSTRVKTPSSRLDSESQPSKRRQRQQPPVERLSGPNVDDLVEKVTNAVLEKLQQQNVFHSNTGNTNLSLTATAPAVQGLVVAEAGNGLSHSESLANNSTRDNNLDQATIAAATLQGSVAAVLGELAGTTSVVGKPHDIFVSTDIPIDMSVSDRLKNKIWRHEYADFAMLLNNKKEHASFIFVFQMTMPHQLHGQRLHCSQIKSQSRSILLTCGSQHIRFLWESIHKNILVKLLR